MSQSGFDEGVQDLQEVLASVDPAEVEALRDAILRGRRIFVTGLGRTGLMARGFAMRLMHLGRRVYHVGDVITPAIGRRDLLVICSRTGGSEILLHYIEKARRAQAKVAVVTASAESPVALGADTIVTLDDRPVQARRREAQSRRHPLGSLYEQALLIVLDQVVMSLMDALDLDEGDLERVHTTFE